MAGSVSEPIRPFSCAGTLRIARSIKLQGNVSGLRVASVAGNGPSYHTLSPNVLILGVLDNGLTQMSVDSYVRQILVGAIIVLAVSASSITRARR